jgi:hypothetical protein
LSGDKVKFIIDAQVGGMNSNALSASNERREMIAGKILVGFKKAKHEWNQLICPWKQNLDIEAERAARSNISYYKDIDSMSATLSVARPRFQQLGCSPDIKPREQPNQQQRGQAAKS